MHILFTWTAKRPGRWVPLRRGHVADDPRGQVTLLARSAPRRRATKHCVTRPRRGWPPASCPTSSTTPSVSTWPAAPSRLWVEPRSGQVVLEGTNTRGELSPPVTSNASSAPPAVVRRTRRSTPRPRPVDRGLRRRGPRSLLGSAGPAGGGLGSPCGLRRTVSSRRAAGTEAPCHSRRSCCHEPPSLRGRDRRYPTDLLHAFSAGRNCGTSFGSNGNNVCIWPGANLGSG
jgi:hypothetical protein